MLCENVFRRRTHLRVDYESFCIFYDSYISHFFLSLFLIHVFMQLEKFSHPNIHFIDVHLLHSHNDLHISKKEKNELVHLFILEYFIITFYILIIMSMRRIYYKKRVFIDVCAIFMTLKIVWELITLINTLNLSLQEKIFITPQSIKKLLTTQYTGPSTKSSKKSRAPS